ncbi:glycosyltransferase family 4 protein [Sulfuricurvum sp.]|uniref:glycosyltransferase family 4 protein n=1 Tax=Sulfuricurvum sp. TaxID=2025608 RepID=UPI002636A029|nr:glycosyltransferase family 4 protein [Sulfuricurvum sp.]MDD2267531.1 glycosyltransferase family 4 protein [Sulfuricurvum sp.]MDD2783685.1 glycosyltransferase family 4 protein [Sulfuricurvum sp.]
MTFGFLSHLDYNIWLFRLPVMQELVRQGHTVYAICPAGEISNSFCEHGITHIPYKIERSSLNPFKELNAIRHIYTAITPLKLDILHTFTAKPNIYGTIAGRFARVPRIINLVEGLGSFYLENDLKSRIVRNLIELLYRQTFKLADTVMFVNHDDPDYLISKKIVSPAKVFIMKGVGIDTNKWRPLSKEDKWIRVTMVARALKHKGVLEFIEAATILTKKYPEVSFQYVGSPDEGNRFSVTETFMKEQTAIHYLGHQTNICHILAQSDIFVLPSYYREGLPRTSMEAASMGLPIVTTDVVGCRETVDDGVNGFLVPPHNINALANAIEKLISNPDLRSQMGQAGREKALKEFDIATIVDKHLEVYGLQRVR